MKEINIQYFAIYSITELIFTQQYYNNSPRARLCYFNDFDQQLQLH